MNKKGITFTFNLMVNIIAILMILFSLLLLFGLSAGHKANNQGDLEERMSAIQKQREVIALLQLESDKGMTYADDIITYNEVEGTFVTANGNFRWAVRDKDPASLLSSYSSGVYLLLPGANGEIRHLRITEKPVIHEIKPKGIGDRS